MMSSRMWSITGTARYRNAPSGDPGRDTAGVDRDRWPLARAEGAHLRAPWRRARGAGVDGVRDRTGGCARRVPPASSSTSTRRPPTGIPVVSHDPTVDASTNSSGPIAQIDPRPAPQPSTTHTGSSRVAATSTTSTAVFTCFRRTGLRPIAGSGSRPSKRRSRRRGAFVNLDLKAGAPEVPDYIRGGRGGDRPRHGVEDEVIVTSFDDRRTTRRPARAGAVGGDLAGRERPGDSSPRRSVRGTLPGASPPTTSRSRSPTGSAGQRARSTSGSSSPRTAAGLAVHVGGRSTTPR